MRNVDPFPSSGAVEIDSTTLVRLLTEYTARLRDLVERADSLRYSRTTLLIISSGALGLVIGMVVWTSMTHPGTDLFAVAVPIGVAFLVGLGAGMSSRFISDRRRELALRRDIVIAARQLERVVRLGEQMQEHSQHDPALRLELELKLADAVATLHYADYDFRVNYTNSQMSAP
jgi:hypothetical protein